MDIGSKVRDLRLYRGALHKRADKFCTQRRSALARERHASAGAELGICPGALRDRRGVNGKDAAYASASCAGGLPCMADADLSYGTDAGFVYTSSSCDGVR